MTQNAVLLGPALAREESYLVTQTPLGLRARWQFDSGHAPHFLCVGTSGGGKTSFLRWLILQTIYLPGEKALYLADGKGADSFIMFTDQPGVAQVVNKDHFGEPKDDHIVKMVRDVHNRTHERYTEFAEAKEKSLKTGWPLDYDLPPLLFFILDDYMDWMQALTDRLQTEMLKRLTSIGQEGREVNVHLGIATQAPYARSVDEGLPGLLKRQLKARIAMCGTMDLDDIEGKLAFNDTKAGERLEHYAIRAGLQGDERLGLGLFAIGRREVAIKSPWVPDPYHWDCTPAEREMILNLLPNKHVQIMEEVS